MKRIISFLCVGSLLVFLFPIRVHADTNTYVVFDDNCQTGVFYLNNQPYEYQNGSYTSEIRVAGFRLTNTVSFFAVSLNPFTCRGSYTDTCTYGNFRDATSFTDDTTGTTFYARLLSSQPTYTAGSIPITDLSDLSYNAGTPVGTYVYTYTFGSGAVAPVEPVLWGDLLDVKFNTSIAGSGSAATNNIDQISWDPVQDSNGNALTSEQRVEIKAIAGNYTASSRNGLFGLGATDFDYNSGIEHLIGNVAANRGEFHIEWSEVIRQLNDGSISDFLNIRKSDDVWLKSGWIYQYRFVADEYTGSWHTIYNGTSAGVQNSINIEQSTQINTNLVNTIVEINTLNNSEQQNWMINNTVINMENSDGQETTDKPWWAYLLEAIVSLIDGVLTFLGNLIGDLISAIIDLFTFDSFDLDVIVDFGTEQRESNNIVGQSINFFDNVVQSAQSMRESDVIISYPGITLFDVELLPAANYNLNEYVEDLGLTDFHNLAYLVTDGSIAICLISLVYRKIMGILRS